MNNIDTACRVVAEKMHKIIIPKVLHQSERGFVPTRKIIQMAKHEKNPVTRSSYECIIGNRIDRGLRR